MYIVRHVRHANECEESKIITTIMLRKRHRVFEVDAFLNMSSCYELCSGTRGYGLCVLLGCVATIVPKFFCYVCQHVDLYTAARLFCP